MRTCGSVIGGRSTSAAIARPPRSALDGGDLALQRLGLAALGIRERPRRTAPGLRARSPALRRSAPGSRTARCAAACTARLVDRAAAPARAAVRALLQRGVELAAQVAAFGGLEVQLEAQRVVRLPRPPRRAARRRPANSSSAVSCAVDDLARRPAPQVERAPPAALAAPRISAAAEVQVLHDVERSALRCPGASARAAAGRPSGAPCWRRSAGISA